MNCRFVKGEDGSVGGGGGGVWWCNVGVGLDGLMRFTGQSTYQHRFKVI